MLKRDNGSNLFRTGKRLKPILGRGHAGSISLVPFSAVFDQLPSENRPSIGSIESIQKNNH